MSKIFSPVSYKGLTSTEEPVSKSSWDFEKIVSDVTQLQLATNHIMPIVRENIQKGWKQIPNTNASRSPKSWFFDPLSLQYSLGYKDKKFSLTYDTLKRVANQLAIISAIVNTRAAQVAAFAQPYRTTRSLGYIIRHKDADHKTTAAEVEFIKELEAFIQNCGRAEKNPYSRQERDDLEGFLRKIIRDSLILDQCCAELVLDRMSLPYEFYAVDASTIRHAADQRTADSNSYHQRDGFVPSMPSRFQGLYTGKEYGEQQLLTSSGKPIKYVQVVQGQIENVYAEDEMLFGVRNPRPDLYINSYGLSELESLITVVTGLLYAERYNMNFFCISGDSLINTRNGMKPVKDLAGKSFEVWTGTKWVNARGFKTGTKPVVRTKLWNGLEIKTSPDHLFRVIPKDSIDGKPVWKKQSELQSGDVTLVNYQENQYEFDYDLLKVDKLYTSTANAHKYDWTPTKELVEDVEFWEMIGFALGDGYWPSLTHKGNCADYKLEIYPHHEKDKELLTKFLVICEKYGINGYKKTVNQTIQRADGQFGYPIVRISHKSFIEWLYELGFVTSQGSRRMPVTLFSQPAKIRAALLRGLFSADGSRNHHRTGYNTPTLYSADPIFQADIILCLWSVGVAGNLVGEGWDREGTIIAQDTLAFVEKIGYLQDYKNANIKRAAQSVNRWDSMCSATSVNVAKELRKSPNWLELERVDRLPICQISRGEARVSRFRAKEYIRKIGETSIENWEELQYSHVEVDVIDTEPLYEEEMYDIEVFDDHHLFLANHIAVHNSQGSTPKGILNFRGDYMTEEQLMDFQRHWIANVQGVESSHRLPITQSEGLEWIDFQKTNVDMEFSHWYELLVKLTCAVYLIDPNELGFPIMGGVSQTPLFESSQEWKLKASRDRGLKPLLKFIAKLLNKNIIDRIDDHFTLEFIGLDEMSEQDKHNMLAEQIASYMTLNEARRQLDLPDLPEGDVPMNPTYIQILQMKNEQKNAESEQQQMQQQTQGQEQQPQAQLPGTSDISPESPQYSDLFNMGESNN